jgi:hypothetical protein
MTLLEAIKAGRLRLRRPAWPADAYLEVVTTSGHIATLWADLYSPREQAAIGEPTPQRVLMCDDETDDYEPVEEDDAAE